jgi:hypothetical protein
MPGEMRAAWRRAVLQFPMSMLSYVLHGRLHHLAHAYAGFSRSRRTERRRIRRRRSVDTAILAMLTA